MRPRTRDPLGPASPPGAQRRAGLFAASSSVRPKGNPLQFPRPVLPALHVLPLPCSWTGSKGCVPSHRRVTAPQGTRPSSPPIPAHGCDGVISLGLKRLDFLRHPPAVLGGRPSRRSASHVDFLIWVPRFHWRRFSLLPPILAETGRPWPPSTTTEHLRLLLWAGMRPAFPAPHH